ncbi:MAG: hypothetical protein FD141_1532 [Fusobacteria bacterium]|nr:MAG: hypothetical protein FD141_1532 [Fusobacteriota bacterium]KAF0230245.1 MAG: hypothetical protein FD182_635 [Fusobacteriota bacterium]
MDQKWIEKWKQDLDQLREELPKKHLNLYFGQSEENFLWAIDMLKEELDEGDLDHFVVISRIARIVAAFKDAHTTVYIPGKWFLPFDFYWFYEGIYIVGGLESYSSLIGCKVTHINDIEIEEVISRLKTVISYENESFLKSQLPKYIRVAEVLYGLDIIKGLKELSIGVEYGNGIASKIQIKTYTEQELVVDYLKIDDMLNDDIPLFRRSGENYWSQHLEEDNTFYINYNCCKNMKNIGVKAFFNGVIENINISKVDKVVVDLRNNFGGNSRLLEPFIKELKKWLMENDRRRVFTVIGRDTFSSALLNAYSLKNDAGAILVGEASGGKPNCYGEVLFLELLNSKLRIRYSTKYYDIIEDDSQESLFPDMKFVVKFDDFIRCKDPVMEYILNREVD